MFACWSPKRLSWHGIAAMDKFVVRTPREVPTRQPKPGARPKTQAQIEQLKVFSVCMRVCAHARMLSSLREGARTGVRIGKKLTYTVLTIVANQCAELGGSCCASFVGWCFLFLLVVVCVRAHCVRAFRHGGSHCKPRTHVTGYFHIRSTCA